MEADEGGWSAAAGFEEDTPGDLLDLLDGERRLGGFENAAGEDASNESRDGDVLCGGVCL